jgi:hypothetical protein
LALVLAAAVVWWFGYRPGEAHYRLLPSSYWAREFKARSGMFCGTRDWFESILLWLDACLNPGRIPAAADGAFLPVLHELLDHPDASVRQGAALKLSEYGESGFRQALPVFIELWPQRPSEFARSLLARRINDLAGEYPEVVRAAAPGLVRCHDLETNQGTRNELVAALRAADVGSTWPPLVYNEGFYQGASGSNLPAGWTAYFADENDDISWHMIADATAPLKSGYVLSQRAGGPRLALHPCVARSPLRNLEVHVPFKAVQGKVEQGGGVLWRWQSPAQYYAAGVNRLDDSLRLYRVVGGQPTELARKTGLKVSAGEWHTLAIKHVGDKIECSLDGTKHLEATDSSIATAGPIGLWTRADAQTHFAELRVIDYGD